MKIITREELDKILEDHKLWLEDNTKGVRANLINANLYNADLTGADLTSANLTEVYDIANKLNEQGICNFIAERIDMHQKWSWQLKSTLGQ